MQTDLEQEASVEATEAPQEEIVMPSREERRRFEKGKLWLMFSDNINITKLFGKDILYAAAPVVYSNHTICEFPDDIYAHIKQQILAKARRIPTDSIFDNGIPIRFEDTSRGYKDIRFANKEIADKLIAEQSTKEEQERKDKPLTKEVLDRVVKETNASMEQALEAEAIQEAQIKPKRTRKSKKDNNNE